MSRRISNSLVGGRRRQERDALGHEHLFMAEDDDIVEGPAEDAGPDRPVAAEKALLPGPAGLGADEPPLRAGELFRRLARGRCQPGLRGGGDRRKS